MLSGYRLRYLLFSFIVTLLGGAGTCLPASAQSLSSAYTLSGMRQRAAEDITRQMREDAVNTWVLSSTKYEPLNFIQEPFVGNGYLGVRIPAIGEGYQGGNLGKSGYPLFNDRYTSTLVAGVYESVKGVDYIASLPTWSEMDLAVYGHVLNAYTPINQISNYRQSVNMYSGVVTTSLTWTPSRGKTVDVSYTVLANRKWMHLGEIRIRFKPSWSGSLALIAMINGNGAERILAKSREADTASGISTVTLQTPGRNTVVAETQALVPGPDVVVEHRSKVISASDKSTIGSRWVIPIIAGKTYQVIKYVGIATSSDPGTPGIVAVQTVLAAIHSGWSTLMMEHRQAWAKLWEGDISVSHHPRLQASIHSSFYLLYSSLRGGLAWSIPPAGLSSDNYGGEIFWDADTWMFPTLLAFDPQLAKSIVDFRYNTRTIAESNAMRAGYEGAMWAWDNGPTGTCGGLAPCSHYEDHLQSDIAFAQWQYYEATGDRQWLIRRGYPVIKDIADFWISRVVLGSDGKYHIDKVTGPDEFTANVNDESATNAGAIVTLRNAIAAAKVIGVKPNPQWKIVADNLYVATDANGTHPEYVGYTNQTIKQADTVLMIYPFGYVANPAIAAKDLDRYMAVTDPGGPAMTASVEGIIAAQIQQPGCLDYTLLQNSYLPFIRGSFDQFLETQYLVPSAGQGPPAFDFATGAGGFLQMFPFGFAGMRWTPSALILAPTLPPQLSGGIILRGIHYQGSRLTVAIGPHHTTVTLNSGAAMRLCVHSSILMLSIHRPIQIPTLRPDLSPSNNLARCQPVTASSAMAANQPAAAVDGSMMTSWRTLSKTSSFEITLKASHLPMAVPVETSGAVIHWRKVQSTNFTVYIKNQYREWQRVDSGVVSESDVLHIRWAATPSLAIRFDFYGDFPASITEIDVPAVKNHLLSQPD